MHTISTSTSTRAFARTQSHPTTAVRVDTSVSQHIPLTEIIRPSRSFILDTSRCVLLRKPRLPRRGLSSPSSSSSSTTLPHISYQYKSHSRPLLLLLLVPTISTHLKHLASPHCPGTPTINYQHHGYPSCTPRPNPPSSTAVEMRPTTNIALLHHLRRRSA